MKIRALGIYKKFLALLFSILLVGLGVGACWEGGAGKDHPESPGSRFDRPVPLVEAPDFQPEKHPDESISDVVAGEAAITAADGTNYNVSFILKNTSSKEIVIDLGPQSGLSPDGSKAILSQPGVTMAMFKDGEWTTIDDQMKLGEDWEPIVRIQPGKTFSSKVQFRISERDKALLEAGNRTALVLHGYSALPATAIGKLILPLSKRTSNAGEAGGKKE